MHTAVHWVDAIKWGDTDYYFDEEMTEQKKILIKN